jgi:hypothetical protein
MGMQWRIYLLDNLTVRETLIRDNSTTGCGDPALCELQVPLARKVAPGKGPFPGLRGRYTGLISHGRQPD